MSSRTELTETEAPRDYYGTAIHGRPDARQLRRIFSNVLSRSATSSLVERTAPDTGIYLLPLAIGNFLGPLLLGRFFDTVGRRWMISGTFAAAALLLVRSGWLFNEGVLSDLTQTACWTVIFFFASAASSSAYLTTSEIFPLETRALAIAFFYAMGTAVGGVLAPWLIGTGSRLYLFLGYLGAAALMLAAAAAEFILGVDAESQSLGKIAEPLSS